MIKQESGLDFAQVKPISFVNGSGNRRPALPAECAATRMLKHLLAQATDEIYSDHVQNISHS
jgi:hypothetical protein